MNRRLRVETQLQTAETDTTLVAAPDGAGGVQFRAEAGGGGGGDCEHMHVTDTFTAEGGSPETFTLTKTPLWDRRVHVAGARVWPGDVGGSGTSVETDTTTGQKVVIDYEAACEPAGFGGAVGDAGSGERGYTWYAMEWPPVPGTWAANTYYPPGSMVVDSNGHTQIRYPNYPLKSGIGEPTWDTGGSYSSDGDGYWWDAGIDPDFDALTQTWAANTNMGSTDSVAIVQPSVPDGTHFCGATYSAQQTGDTEPVWPTTPGAESFNDGYGSGFLITSRPFVLGSLAIPGYTEGPDWTVDDADQGAVEFIGSVSVDQVVPYTYTPT